MMLDVSRQKVLLFKRSADTQGAGLWSIPGGARPVRAGRPAPALNTAVTELREEAPPLPHGQLWSVPFEYRDAESGFSCSTFFMTLTWPQLYEPRLNWEHDEYQRFELGELTARRDLHPGVIDAIQAIGEVLPERMNEVVPGLFVGNAASAANLDLLNAHGIGHVINSAGEDCRNAHESDLRDPTFPLRDGPDSQTTPLIGQAVASIKQALAGSGKVLVHCEMGRSRSASRGAFRWAGASDAIRRWGSGLEFRPSPTVEA